MAVKTKKIESLVRKLLIEIGEDPEREGLVKTPHRVAAALEFLTSGSRTDPVTVINDAIFTQKTNSMVPPAPPELQKEQCPKKQTPCPQSDTHLKALPIQQESAGLFIGKYIIPTQCWPAAWW